MSIVKEIIELHGGELAISSEVGFVTRVSLCLPG
jgi:signal transduction histidine kinase